MGGFCFACCLNDPSQWYQFFIICRSYVQYNHTVVLFEVDCFKDQGFWHTVRVDKGTTGKTVLTFPLWCDFRPHTFRTGNVMISYAQRMKTVVTFGKGLNIKHDRWVGVIPSPVPATVCALVLWFWETRVAFFIQPVFILCTSYVSVNRGLNHRGINKKKMIFPLEIRG